MKYRFLLILIIMQAMATAQSRIAEIVDIEGVRDNDIRGVGLVIGLNKTGDKSIASRRMLSSILKRSNVNVLEGELGTGNAAVVMVTARIDPFKRPGSRIDVTVSSINDSTSLFGGTLLETHLEGFDRSTVYAIAEGPISVTGVAAEGQSGSSVTINHPTAGTIANGAKVEKAIPMQVTDRRGMVVLNLKNQDWTTALNIEKAINAKFPGAARAVNAGSVDIMPVDGYHSRITEFISMIFALPVEVHMVSKVVIDSRTGVIVAGQDVKVSTIAVAQGKLSVSVQEAPEAVVASPFTQGQTLGQVPRTDVTVNEENSDLQVVQGGESVGKLAQSLNALGATPRQLIGIFEAIKTAGALQAELIIK